MTTDKPTPPLASPAAASLDALARIVEDLEGLDERDRLITIAYIVDRFVSKRSAAPIRRKL